ncbi:MAG: endonuclease [Bacilli bacterium]|nr:endonuclease [Bacilli bacterium]
MKIVFKILSRILLLVVLAAIGFILTLQIFEYRPEEITELQIENNLGEASENMVSLGDPIDILTFNIGYASLSATEDFAMDGGTKGRMDSLSEVEANIAGISAILETYPSEIYLLQEVDEDSARSYHTNQFETFKSQLDVSTTLGYNYRCIFVPFPFSFSQMMGSVNSGIVSLIDYHVTSASRHQLPGSFSWPISLANLKRCMVVHRLPIQDSEKEFIVINVHLSAYDDGTMRLQEMEALKTLILDEYEQGNYVLVGGDFNQTFPDAVTISETTEGTTQYDYLYELKNPDLWEAFPMESDWFDANGFSFGIDTSLPTCRLLHQPYDTENQDNNQYYVIDGFIISDNIEIITVETVDHDFTYSDHNPVRIEIRLIP